MDCNGDFDGFGAVGCCSRALYCDGRRQDAPRMDVDIQRDCSNIQTATESQLTVVPSKWLAQRWIDTLENIMAAGNIAALIVLAITRTAKLNGTH